MSMPFETEKITSTQRTNKKNPHTHKHHPECFYEKDLISRFLDILPMPTENAFENILDLSAN